VVSRPAIAGVALSIMAVALLGFVADVTIVGSLRHGHAQAAAYAELRGELANAIAPVGPRDYNGHLLSLGAPVAVLRIPAAGIDEVVLEGTSSGVLADGAGHLRGTVLPGQAGTSVVFGRRAGFGGPFNHLPALHAGAVFAVTTGQGTFSYRVAGTTHGTAVGSAPASEGRLALVTAGGTPWLPHGVVQVDAELVGTPAATPAPDAAVHTLPADEAAMSGDSSAWVGVVIWGEALVLGAVLVAWARSRWGRRQAWVVGVPTLVALGVAVADQTARLVPNLF
jgi:hypothetical protein